MVSKAVLLPPAEIRRGRAGGVGLFQRPAPARLPLLPLANRPLLLHALDSLSRAGIREAALVAPEATFAELREVIEEDGECDLRLSWIELDRGGLSAALDAAEHFLGNDRFLLHLLDCLLLDDLRPVLEASGRGPLDVTLLAEPGSRPRLGGEVVPLRGGRLNHVSSAGVYLLGAGALGASRDAPELSTHERELAAAVDLLVAQGGRLDVHKIERAWRYRFGPEFLLDGNRLALEGLRGDTRGAALIDSRVQGPVVVDPTARIESTILRGPAIIGAHARLRHAYVGPYTAIGADVSIEGAEVENSIVLPGATISHLAGRLESSVIGSRARVTRDFRLPKALRLNLGEDAEVCLA
jgi:glucose-1-phosphate thymidylyltransferase